MFVMECWIKVDGNRIHHTGGHEIRTAMGDAAPLIVDGHAHTLLNAPSECNGDSYQEMSPLRKTTVAREKAAKMRQVSMELNAVPLPITCISTL